MTSAGAVPIEAIEVGDLVLSRDSATGEQALRPVTELYRNEATELVHVDLGDETITATSEHPFWVEGTGWVDAGELAAGDEVARADGSSTTIVSVVREHLQSPVDVYNFEVAEYHTYFVASAGVWVHNACGRVSGGVYSLRDKVTNEVVRTGRTKNFAARRWVHNRVYGNKYRFQAEYFTDSRNVARGLEQALHQKHATTAHLNKIRGIARTNKNARRYGRAAAQWLAKYHGGRLR